MIRILLICDIQSYRQSLEQILLESIPNCEIIHIASCKLAGPILLQENFDSIIIIDNNSLSSYEFCKQLKTGNNINTPLLISLSEFANDNEKMRWIEAGADGFIGYPATKSDILTHVKVLLRLKFLETKYFTENQKTKDFFFELNKSLNSTESMHEFLNDLQKNLNSLLDASNFYVALYNLLDDTLSLPYFKDEKDVFETISIENTLAALVIRSKKSLLLSKREILNKVQSGEIKLFGSLCESWLGTPLVLKNKLIGMMAVQSYSKSTVYSENDIQLMEFLSTQIAILIDRKDNELKLKDALRQAEESEKLKTAFLSNLSHEIRTPMNAIMGFASLLEMDDISKSEKRNFISIILENGNTLLKMIDDLVDISKLETGELIIHKTETDIIEILRILLSTNLKKISTLKKTHLKLKLDIDKRINKYVIKTDPFRLNQILNNLLDNAIKFTESGEIVLGYRKIKDSYVEFFVRDTGIGIEEQYHNLIFEKFRQIEIGDIRIFGGNGLGLHICKCLAKNLGGDISLISQYGIGSEFKLKILSETSKYLDENETIEKDNSFNWNTKTILIADDVSSNFAYLSALLKPTLINTIWAKNGKEAVEIANGDAIIDLILMDIQMPVLNGFQANRLIKQNHSEIPVIAITAFDELANSIEIENSYFVDYITKPIHADSLLPKIDYWLNQ